MTTTPVVVTAPELTKPRGIAPRWHTAVLIIVLLAFSFATAKNHGQFVGRRGRMPLYIATIVWEYALLGFVCFGVWRRGGKVRDLVGGKWNEFEDFLIDIAIAAGYWIVSLFALWGVGYLVGFTDQQKMTEARKAIEFLLPHGATEMIVWAWLSITAGFCEEIIFRGYFQRQLTALSGSLAVGILTQALLFGLGHGYEGMQRMVIIAVWGCMFGVLANWRKSLRPGMMTHAFHDGLVGLAGRFLMNAAR